MMIHGPIFTRPLATCPKTQKLYNICTLRHSCWTTFLSQKKQRSSQTYGRTSSGNRHQRGNPKHEQIGLESSKKSSAIHFSLQQLNVQPRAIRSTSSSKVQHPWLPIRSKTSTILAISRVLTWAPGLKEKA